MDPICVALGIDPPMQEKVADPQIVEIVRSLSPEQQRDVLDFIHRFVLRKS